MSETEMKEEKPSFKSQFLSSIEINNNLSGIYLWLLFGYLSVYVNCDLQRFLKDKPIVLHVVGIYTFFFLFTSLDTQNTAGLFAAWVKTIFIYFLFVLTTKSKWYFVVTVLLFLLIDKCYKYYIETNKKYWTKEEQEKQTSYQKNVTFVLTIAMISTIIVGVIQYIYLQKIEYKDKFSYYKFFVDKGRCKRKTPSYDLEK